MYKSIQHFYKRNKEHAQSQRIIYLILRHSHHNYTYDAKVEKNKSDAKRNTGKATNHRRLHHSHDYEKGRSILIIDGE